MIVDPIGMMAPDIGHGEIEHVLGALTLGWNRRKFEYVRQFEQNLAKRAGLPHAFAASSHVAAVHLALIALGAGPGTEVLVPSLVDKGIVGGVLYCGAKVVPCDMHPQTLCLDPESVRQRLSAKTRILIISDFFGHMPDMDMFHALAKEYNIRLLVASSWVLGGNSPSLADKGQDTVFVLGFDHYQVMNCGGGGMVLSADKQVMDKVRQLGMLRQDGGSEQYGISGFDYQMPNLTAALGVGCLEKMDTMLAAFSKIASWYRDLLANTGGERFMLRLPADCLCPAVPLLRVEQGQRKDFLEYLEKHNVFAIPVDRYLTDLSSFEQADLPVARDICSRCVVLPYGSERTTEEVAFVCDRVKAYGAQNESTPPEVTGWLKHKSEVLEFLGRCKKQGGMIPFTHEGKECSLRVITVADAYRDETVAFELAFQKNNQHAFFKHFTVTEDYIRTMFHNYATSNRDFILFFVCMGPDAYGHIGLNKFDFKERSCVAEGFMMTNNAPRGLAAAASDTMYAWAQHELGMEYLYCHTVGSNKTVRLLAASQGFREINRTALRSCEVQGEKTFRPMYIMENEQPDEFFVVSAKRLSYEPLR